MKKRVSAMFLVGAMVVGLMPAGAQAARPLDVDCDLLGATIEAVHDFLQAETPVDFESIGDLMTSLKDPDAFAELSFLILDFSGGEIEFTDYREVVPTVAKCGLMPLLVGVVQE